MKFETKLNKLGIDENEVKSIIMNCECGEINGAYFIDLTKEKKEFIMEVVGNYLDDDSEEVDYWGDIKRIATFCKVFGISEEEIPKYYRLGFNEGGCDIAYELESNPNVILVLTDDERYHNSFIQYSPSQEEIEQYTKELEELEKEYIRLGELKPVKKPLRIFDEPATKVNCEIHIRRKGAKYQCRYHDIQKLTQDEIEFINSRNTSQNIIKKLEILRDAEIGDDMSADEQEWYSFGRGSNILVINELIDELREIEKENGKISISKDWKHYITLKVREDTTSSSSSENLESQLESLTSQYDAKIEELTQLDDETNVEEICIDKELMAEYEDKKAKIDEESYVILEKIDEVQDKMEAQTMTEKWVSFKIVSKNDERIYIAGQFDVNSYDEDTDLGDWEYEQNDGTYESHLPRYWKVDGESLSFEYGAFIDCIDWDIFRQYLFDYANENRSIDCGVYLLHINNGATMECEIKEPTTYRGDYVVEVIPKFNGRNVDLVTYMVAMNEKFDPYDVDGVSEIEAGHIYFEISKDYYSDNIDDIDDAIELVNEEARRIFARSITYELGIYAQYGESVEQSLDDSYNNDWLFKMTLLDDGNLKDFLKEEGIIEG